MEPVEAVTHERRKGRCPGEVSSLYQQVHLPVLAGRQRPTWGRHTAVTAMTTPVAASLKGIAARAQRTNSVMSLQEHAICAVCSSHAYNHTRIAIPKRSAACAPVLVPPCDTVT